MKPNRQPPHGESRAVDALRRRFAKRALWTRYLRQAVSRASIDELEAAVWVAVAWYSESPTRAAELELKRAARAFGIEAPSDR